MTDSATSPSAPATTASEFEELAWYRTEARPFLLEHSPDRLENIDRRFARVKELDQQVVGDVPVCFLGGSGVGKSTLINSLVSGERSVLPQGGVGPLTAQATVVRYANDPSFSARYLGADRLGRLLFALERHHETALARAKVPEPANRMTTGDILAVLSEEAKDELEILRPQETAEGTNDTLLAYIRQARLLIRGDQFSQAELPYLLDGLRLCLGRDPRWGSTPVPEDLDRIQAIRDALGFAKARKERVVTGSNGLAEFQAALNTHASGFLSPLISRLEVGWEAPCLENGLVLVDLPGVGVANDEYRAVTTEWIRRARAVVLVVDRAGVTEASAELLRTTGFMNALLHDDPDADSIRLIVAIVKLDLSADDARRDDKARDPSIRRPWVDYFNESCTRAIELVKGQVQAELERLVVNGPDETREARAEATKKVLLKLEVHPVSALEYRRNIVGDEEDRSRIKEPDESRIPQLANKLKDITLERILKRDAQREQLLKESVWSVRTALDALQSRSTQAAVTAETVAKMERSLEVFLQPFRAEVLAKQGAYREFLRESMPKQIELRLEQAVATAQREIAKFLRTFETCHWRTLQAAIRRGGTYDGSRHIDLPNEITLRFEEPIAVAWRKHVLQPLRERTSELIRDYDASVEDVAKWTPEQGDNVRPELLAEIRSELGGDAALVLSEGNEAVDDLRTSVKKELVHAIADTVRLVCRKFVAEGHDRGAGVKQRMLSMILQELAAEISASAKIPAGKFLTAKFNATQEKMSAAVARYRNPVDLAAATLMRDVVTGLEGTEAEHRRIAQAAASLIARLPSL